ncbi:hypothetical protein [Streptomyces sp. URMC 129]|uniref:hypothetical protein n=1 Tax=Streptomyces sp. URMC 129 TaxID=3423407 RepID=UPI003F1B06B8
MSHEDIAAVAAAVLTEDGHENRTYVVTGPELFSQAQLAELLADVVGVKVPVAQADDEAMPALLAEDGFPEPLNGILAQHLEAIRLGCFDDRTTVVREVTGREPRSLRSVLDEHRDALLAALGP